ncbi:hypothetical protein PVL29_019959 [Vitis rotundifolia]|uniref:Uncharacterized protein n=1 Tax=Vitis rotundifolia TaxID=103349 RepID=A0AA39DE81_VITRO|nr:hypothetical protein PVL29_019959 [Vitis rotundifolia]
MGFDWQDHKEKEQKKQEMDDSIPSLDERSTRPKVPHCSICGHPGRKKSHHKFSNDFCGTFPRKGCLEKPEGFVCDCSTCDMVIMNCNGVATNNIGLGFRLRFRASLKFKICTWRVLA